MATKVKPKRRGRALVPTRGNGPAVVIDPGNPLAMLHAMIQQGAEPEPLRQMMDLAERFEKNKAAAAFGNALARFQSECPMILKERQASMANASYKYASLDDIMAEVGPVLSRCNIAVSFSAPKKEHEGWFEIDVHLRVGSHEEVRPFAFPVGDLAGSLKEMAGRMKSINTSQAYGLWLSYQKRYAFCAALNIVVTDEDTDAGPPKMVTLEQGQELGLMVGRMPAVNQDQFWRWLSERCKCTISTAEQVRAADFEMVKNFLVRKLAGVKTPDAVLEPDKPKQP